MEKIKIWRSEKEMYKSRQRATRGFSHLIVTYQQSRTRDRHRKRARQYRKDPRSFQHVQQVHALACSLDYSRLAFALAETLLSTFTSGPNVRSSCAHRRAFLSFDDRKVIGGPQEPVDHAAIDSLAAYSEREKGYTSPRSILAFYSARRWSHAGTNYQINGRSPSEPLTRYGITFLSRAPLIIPCNLLFARFVTLKRETLGLSSRTLRQYANLHAIHLPIYLPPYPSISTYLSTCLYLFRSRYITRHCTQNCDRLRDKRSPAAAIYRKLRASLQIFGVEDDYVREKPSMTKSRVYEGTT